ncbi:unnamed protein product [Anisakis simplex]|uniref:Antistasin-like domain-containing protein n=1 Tax=Anisakis simplex TaxID=6269 RepID=A0A0M3JXK8_ANISI|nr:unnamed protein product [Anisakis simplex]
MLTIRNCFILLLIIVCSYGVAIGTFQCPDRCEISYKPNGCPHNCNCGPAKKCPLVTCPAKAPTCAVYTQLDGCQTCACRIPYLLVESESEKEILNAGIIFVNRKDMVEVRRKLRDATRRRSFRDREVLKTQACTIDFMEKVDGCLTNASYLHEELKKKVTSMMLKFIFEATNRSATISRYGFFS